MLPIAHIVMVSYVTGMPFKLKERPEMIRYLFNHTNREGRWGREM